MSGDAVLILHTVFTQCWRLFTEWRIPGTGVSPGMWALFALTVVTTIRLARIFFNLGGDSDK